MTVYEGGAGFPLDYLQDHNTDKVVLDEYKFTSTDMLEKKKDEALKNGDIETLNKINKALETRD
jgi:hypothetical protein